MNIIKFSEKPKILLIQGSPRSENNCPGMESKTSKIVEHIKNKYKGILDIDVVDLSIKQKKPIIQPCKGCISTAGGYHCNFPCSCYYKGDKSRNKDLMYEQDVYEKLEWCDAFVVFSPIYWHSVTSQVKTMFDRLVCINLTLTHEEALKIFGDNLKTAKITGSMLQNSKSKLKNHLEGKYAAFYIHGDNGASDYSNQEFPESYNKDEELDIKWTIKPIVNQCRYSGIFVPDDLVETFYMNENKDYYTANLSSLDFANTVAENLIERLIRYLKIS